LATGLESSRAGRGVSTFSGEISKLSSGRLTFGSVTLTLGSGALELGFSVAESGLGSAVVGFWSSDIGLGSSDLGIGCSSIGLRCSEFGLGRSGSGGGSSILGFGRSSIGLASSFFDLGAPNLDLKSPIFELGKESRLTALFASSDVELFLRLSPTTNSSSKSPLPKYPLSTFFTSLSSRPFLTPCSLAVNLPFLGGIYEQVKSACQNTWLLQCIYDAAMVGGNDYARTKAHHLQVLHTSIYSAFSSGVVTWRRGRGRDARDLH
jgi:hypothetical protein